MDQAAEQAYRQALELWPGNTETLNNFSDLLFKQKRAPELRDFLEKASKADPNNGLLVMLLTNCERRIALAREIQSLEARWSGPSKDVKVFQELLGKYSEDGNLAKADPLIVQGATLFATNVDVLRDVVNYFAIQNRVPMAIDYGKKLDKLVPEDAEVKLGMAKFYIAVGNRVEFYKFLQDAIRFGGLPMREKVAMEPIFQQVQSESDFQKLIRASQ
jgi:Tfp pilus assembly protein PilF